MNVKSFEKLKCATAYFLQGQARWGAHFPEGGCSNVLPSSSAKGKRGGESSETQPLAHAGPWKIHTASLLCTESNFLPSWKFRLKPLKNWFQWDLEYTFLSQLKSHFLLKVSAWPCDSQEVGLEQKGVLWLNHEGRTILKSDFLG